MCNCKREKTVRPKKSETLKKLKSKNQIIDVKCASQI